MFAHDQLDAFHARGFARLEGLHADLGPVFEDFVWEKIRDLHGVDRRDRATWDVPGVWGGLKDFRGAPLFQQIGSPELVGAIDALLGEEDWKRPRDWGGFLA